MKISQLSKLTNTPASTIRDYEYQYFIEPAQRLDNGYRIFDERHVVQIKLCRLAFKVTVSKHLRKASLQVLYAAGQGDMLMCQQKIEEYIGLIDAEIQKVNDVMEIIKKWISHGNDEESKQDYSLKMAAECIGTTKETIRNWERNGLLNKSFSTYQRRIYTTSDIERMRIIYMLLQTGYSVMAIHKFFSTLSQNNNNALLILTNPDKDEDLFSIQDRWLQTLKAAKAEALKMQVLINKKI